MKKNFVFMAVAALVLALAPTAQAGIIYSDDFTGDAGDLNGTGPGWIANTTTGWQLDGSGEATTGSGDRWAWLPFTPTTANVYTLSADITTGAGSLWNAIGFANDGTAGGSPPADDTVLFTTDTYAWMLRKGADINNTIETFNGAGTANGSFGSTAAGTMKIVIDTQPTFWTVEYFVGGTSLGTPKAYTANPTDIRWVGFGSIGAPGTVDNFLLTDASVIPEPTSLSLLALGGLGVLLMRRRRA